MPDRGITLRDRNATFRDFDTCLGHVGRRNKIGQRPSVPRRGFRPASGTASRTASWPCRVWARAQTRGRTRSATAHSSGSPPIAIKVETIFLGVITTSACVSSFHQEKSYPVKSRKSDLRARYEYVTRTSPTSAVPLAPAGLVIRTNLAPLSPWATLSNVSMTRGQSWADVPAAWFAWTALTGAVVQLLPLVRRRRRQGNYYDGRGDWAGQDGRADDA